MAEFHLLKSELLLKSRSVESRETFSRLWPPSVLLCRESRCMHYQKWLIVIVMKILSDTLNEIEFLFCQKRPAALKYLLIFHQNRQKQNGSKCTNDNPWTWPLGLYWFPKRSASVKDTTVQLYNSKTVFILEYLQCLHKSRRKRNPHEITDYFLCNVDAHAWMSCILCKYAPVRTI